MNKKIYIILGGSLKKEKNKWRTTNFNENGDDFGVLGDRLRVVAGSYLYKDDPNLLFITSCGKGQYKNIQNAPNVSSVLKKELIELGVPQEKITEENNSNNTWQQLQEIKKITQRDGLEQVIIISNRYHLPRITAMIEKDSELNKLFKQSIIKLQSAEDIVLKYNPKKWGKIVDDAYKSESMKKRIKLEEKGVKDIKKGTYKLE